MALGPERGRQKSEVGAEPSGRREVRSFVGGDSDEAVPGRLRCGKLIRAPVHAVRPDLLRKRRVAADKKENAARPGDRPQSEGAGPAPRIPIIPQHQSRSRWQRARDEFRCRTARVSEEGEAERRATPVPRIESLRRRC